MTTGLPDSPREMPARRRRCVRQPEQNSTVPVAGHPSAAGARALFFPGVVCQVRGYAVAPAAYLQAPGEIDPLNDGQLLFIDQLIPGSALLGYVNADHWTVAIPVEEKFSGRDPALKDRNRKLRDASF